MYKKLGTPRHANESVDYRAKCDDEGCTTSIRFKKQPGDGVAKILRDRGWLVRDHRHVIGRPNIYCSDHASKHETKKDREARRKRQRRRSRVD